MFNHTAFLVTDIK